MIEEAEKIVVHILDPRTTGRIVMDSLCRASNMLHRLAGTPTTLDLVPNCPRCLEIANRANRDRN